MLDAETRQGTRWREGVEMGQSRSLGMEPYGLRQDRARSGVAHRSRC